ncbi:MAG TPA: cupredoxin family copper-binding protein, partial [Gemmatimonadaceae bacterium]|nr:cupredoxin family copper-binding protein [Gemmatimonadaceae bacterium]
SLAIVDATLSGQAPAFDAAARDGLTKKREERAAAALAANQIGIDNFAFTPATLTVPHGTAVTWINRDDVPHLIVNVQQQFKQSPVLDTDQRFSATLDAPGTYDVYCALHPKMQGRVIVTP